MADYAEAMAEPVQAAPDVPGEPLFCAFPGCYGDPEHSGPHSDYEGVNLPSGA
jgi:hypothetical protein